MNCSWLAQATDQCVARNAVIHKVTQAANRDLCVLSTSDSTYVTVRTLPNIEQKHKLDFQIVVIYISAIYVTAVGV